MADAGANEALQQGGTAMKRRGILRAAGTAVGVALAGIVAKQTSESVAATTTDSNFIATSTTVTNFAAHGAATYGFDTSQGTFEYGVVGSGSNTGVTGNGTYGVSGGGSSTGVFGNGNAYGVYGFGPTGVYGNSTTTGVYGNVSGTAANTVAVQGHNQATGAGGIGVQGIAQSGYGVGGFSGGVGVYGLSSGSYGIVGITTAGAPYSGITGGASLPGAAAFAGGGTNGAYAAYFTGPVVVDGSFTVVNPVNKHGAITHPDGSYRTLYSMESPESWLEDFGKGTLANGRATVALDTDFAAITQTDDYRVFPVPEGDCNGLYITNKSAAGFEVRELKGGTGNVAFSWRVVAQPKTDGKAQRLAKFTLPNIKIPTITDLPKMPDPLKPPASPSVPKKP